MLKMMEGDCVEGEFGRPGGLLCRASHEIISLQVYD